MGKYEKPQRNDVNSTERSDILVFNCYLCHVRYFICFFVGSTKIGENSDISKCFENFVSQTLGVLTRIYAAELRYVHERCVPSSLPAIRHRRDRKVLRTAGGIAHIPTQIFRLIVFNTPLRLIFRIKFAVSVYFYLLCRSLESN